MTATTSFLLISGTGTGVGKTCLTRGLARALLQSGVSVAAVKPIETGCEPRAADADALAGACCVPALADDPAWYRAAPPLAPAAISRLEGRPGPDLARIVARIESLSNDVVLVEGAGGLLVPLDPHHTIADLGIRLRAKLLLVAPNRLGVLSDVLAIREAAERRRLDVLAIVLTSTSTGSDPSSQSNAALLRERLDVPVLEHRLPDLDADEDHARAIRGTELPEIVLAAR